MKRLIILLGLIGCMAGAIHAQKPEYLNENTFKQKVYDYENERQWKYRGDKPAIVDFYADWCGPCKYVAPFLDQIAAEYGSRIKIYKVNTDYNAGVSRAFGINGIPTFLFIKANGEKKKIVGAMAKAGFEKEIKEYLKLSK